MAKFLNIITILIIKNLLELKTIIIIIVLF